MESDPSSKEWPTLPPAGYAGAQPPPMAPGVPPPIPLAAEDSPEEEQLSRGRRRRRHGHGTHFRRGRLWLVAIFCGLRLIEVMIYVLINSGPGIADKSQLHGKVITNGIWTTALLAAIWFRQAWARYLLIVMILFRALIEVVYLPETLKELPDSVINPFLIAEVLIYIGIAYVLIAVPAVKRLTNKSYA